MNIFKNNWEKTQHHMTLEEAQIKRMVAQAFPQKELLEYKVIDGGCANINVKINLENYDTPFIVRVYIREPNSAALEASLGARLEGILPAPSILFSGEDQRIPFSIGEYKEGITLREGLIRRLCPVEKIMRDVGMLLSKLQSFSFPSAGFFDSTLTITETITRETYMQFFKTVMASSNIHATFDYSQRIKIEQIFHENHAFLPDDEESHLVHGDFDPANILIYPVNDQWEVSGILDWEFSFSGSSLHDVANMLRYAHRLPNDIYENSFLQGLRDGGYVLPENWKKTTHLLNLLALLESLNRCNLKKSPMQVFDISDLIQWIVRRLSSEGEQNPGL